MKNALVYVLCLLVLVLPGCGMLTPAQRDSGKVALEEAFQRGEITASQRDQAMDALDGKTVDWTELLTTGGSVLASILLGVPVAVGVVNRKRGPTEAQRQAARAAAAAKSA